MRPQYIMFLGLIFAAGTLISLTFAGLWLGSDEIDVTNTLAVFKQADILGIWSVTIPNIDFFLTGAKALTMMDFAFFEGEMALLQWFFIMTIGLGAIWGFYTIIIGVVQGIFTRR